MEDQVPLEAFDRIIVRIAHIVDHPAGGLADEMKTDDVLVRRIACPRRLGLDGGFQLDAVVVLAHDLQSVAADLEPLPEDDYLLMAIKLARMKEPNQ